MKRILRSLLILICASAAFGAGWWWLRQTPRHWWREDIVAEIQGETVTVADAADGLRTYLWSRGQSWEMLSEEERTGARREVVDGLIRQRLLRHARKQHPPLDVQAATAREFEIWRKQFQQDGELTLRLGWQELDEKRVEQRIAEAEADRAWLERVVSERLSLPTEAELREWFADHAESLRIPAAHRAAHIYLTRHDKEKPDRRAEIHAIHQKLIAGEATFADLAAEFSEDERNKKRGGDLGWFTRDRMPEDFMAAVEALKPEETSAPVATALGWHILRVTERKPSRLPNFEEVRGEIDALLTSQARDEATRQVMAELLKRHEQDLWQGDAEALAKIEPAKIHEG